MIINRPRIVKSLDNLAYKNSISRIKAEMLKIKDSLLNHRYDKHGFSNVAEDKKTLQVDSKYLLGEIDQILETKTLPRARYYIKRLVRGLCEIKTISINDLNLNRWKEYDDVITESLWLFDKRDRSKAHNASYWGNFVPQIPNQFLKRYTKKGDWVLDVFLGSGTTLIESKKLGRNGIGVELRSSVVKLAKKNISKEKNPYNVAAKVINADSSELDFKKELGKLGKKSVQFIIMHPPYWDIIRFSEHKRDLSNAKTKDEFLKLFGKVVDNTYEILENNRYMAVVMGDKYSAGEWIPLGFYTMQEVLKRGYKLKSIIVKNFEETKGKASQKELWRYRALAGGFYIFKHEYIFLFKK